MRSTRSTEPCYRTTWAPWLASCSTSALATFPSHPPNPPPTAYLLHPPADGDATFERILRTFAERYRGRRARTEDFRRVAEEVTGADLGPFFRKYIDGTDDLEYPQCP